MFSACWLHQHTSTCLMCVYWWHNAGVHTLVHSWETATLCFHLPSAPCSTQQQLLGGPPALQAASSRSRLHDRLDAKMEVHQATKDCNGPLSCPMQHWAAEGQLGNSVA